jgi:hypothetical protein
MLSDLSHASAPASARRRVVAAARSLVGTPWRHQGRSAARVRGGLDCAGLVIVAGRMAGVLHDEADVTGYRRDPDARTMVGALAAWGRPVLVAQPGDVAAMRVASSAYPHHVGIVSDLPDGRLGLIHSFASLRRVVEHALDEPGQSISVVGYWSFRGLEDEPWRPW